MATQKEKIALVRTINLAPSHSVHIAQTDADEKTSVQTAIAEVSAFMQKNKKNSYTLIAVKN